MIPDSTPSGPPEPGGVRRRLQPRRNNPGDDGNAIAGVVYPLLIEAVVVALVVLLHWLF